MLHIKSAQPHHAGSYQCRVQKEISSKRTMVSESDIVTLKISSKSSGDIVIVIVDDMDPFNAHNLGLFLR